MCLSMNKIPKQKNVLGEDIEPCSMNPITGWFRDGSCNTDKTDVGVHCVCAKVNNDFLNWCKENGNDLITPHPEFGFEGLKDAVNADPSGWLGEKHVQRFGVSTEVLVKLLDPDQRLPVHYHPDQKFAKDKLHLNHGKTEAWIILEAPAGARVGLGFKKQMDKSEIAQLVKAHNSEALLDSLVFKEVKPGDAVFVPAGVAHAIEAGIFVLELQEPTDLSILLEWDGFAVDGDKDGHLNLGYKPSSKEYRTPLLTWQLLAK